jgi:DNA-binding CsgD family transcriptional regulator
VEGFQRGYSGNRNLELQDFIKRHREDKHLLFMKPSHNFMVSSSPENLKKIGDVNVIVLGNGLPVELIGFLQEYKISGYIKPDEINALTISQIVKEIEKHGFSANYHIPEEYWVNKPKHVFPRPKPQLTKGEEEVLSLLCHNYNVKEISDKLLKNEPAIRAQITNLRQKLEAQSLLEIVVIAMANSWVVIDVNKTSSSSPFLKDRPKND